MHNLNKLMRNTLITYEEVLFHAPTKHAMDIRMVESSIIIAEERFIRPELGFDLYDAILSYKNKIVADENEIALLQPLLPAGTMLAVGDLVNAFEFLPPAYLALWKQHLWKLTAECVITSAYPEGFVQLGAEGAFHNSPPAGLMVTSGFVSPLLTSMKWSIDKKVKDRIAPLLQSMHNYFCKNKSDFALYKGICAECVDENKQLKYTGVALNIYEEDEEECCKGRGWR